ncbi:hypothetical protein [Dyadobacter fanqingshengii]|uniref:Transporter n=1 Tax=Dyadobacter fanqingshengii TaxID=2906443 RepID=A0A9X1TA74_9BACT|nr:hypothetical protein [Dyadobacter fanqingshengii]MCF0042215.1 hypothetical protein [Dyadobacter fanqingshengii]USJ35254.1 hypothetical protein NFI81_21485 [Dyadobacter fanqingshengii]
MKKIFTILFLVCLCITQVTNNAFAQGCVAIRGMSHAGATSADFFKQQNGKFQVNAGYRFFRSYKHFRGDHEEKERVEQGTEVINVAHALDLGLTYQPNMRWSISVTLPVQHNDRSSLYEHYGNPVASNPEQKRFHTSSKGIGDLRISTSYWLRDPLKMPKFNMAIGGGIKLPTGDKAVEGEFHKLDKEGNDYTIVKPVDQSIQLGDGAVGFFLETQGYVSFTPKTALYFNGFYLSNPKEHNGVNRNPQSATIDPIVGYFAAVDQFAARLGVSQALGGGFSVLLGGRAEGVPSDDLIGSSKGYRRPGYVISGEPGVAYIKNKFSASLSVPIALYRNRTKSYADKQDVTGKAHGDAAFADYLISFSVSRWF